MQNDSALLVCLVLTEEYFSAALSHKGDLLSIRYEGKDKTSLYFEIASQIKPVSRERYRELDIAVQAIQNPIYGMANGKTFDFKGQSQPYEKLFDALVENIKLEYEKIDNRSVNAISLLPIYSPAFSHEVITKLNAYFEKKGFHLLPPPAFIQTFCKGIDIIPPSTLIECFGERSMLHFVGEKDVYQTYQLQSIHDWDFEKELVRFILQRAMRQVPNEIDLDEEVALHVHRAEDWLNQIREERKSFISINLSNDTSATAIIFSYEVEQLRIQARLLAQRIADQSELHIPIWLIGDLLNNQEIKSILTHRGYKVQVVGDEESIDAVLKGVKLHLASQGDENEMVLEETLIREAIPQFLVYKRYLPKKQWLSFVNQQGWSETTMDEVVAQNSLQILPSIEILIAKAQEIAKEDLLSNEHMKELRLKAKQLEVSENELEQRLQAMGIKSLPLRELLEAHIERRKVENYFPSEYFPQLLAVAEQNGFSEKELEVFLRQRNLKLQTREEILQNEFKKRLKGKMLAQEHFEEILTIGDQLNYSKAEIEILMDKQKIKLTQPKGIGIFLISGIVLAALAVGIILTIKFPDAIPLFSPNENTSTTVESTSTADKEKITNPEMLIGKYIGLVFHTELKRNKNSRLEILAVREENGEFIFTYSIPQDRFQTWKGRISLEEQLIDFMPPENARHRVGKYRFFKKSYKEGDGSIRRTDIILQDVTDSTQHFMK